jgi:hypothetical protein
MGGNINTSSITQSANKQNGQDTTAKINLASRHQNVGQNHNTKTAYIFLQHTAKFKCLGMPVTIKTMFKKTLREDAVRGMVANWIFCPIACIKLQTLKYAKL